MKGMGKEGAAQIIWRLVLDPVRLVAKESVHKHGILVAKVSFDKGIG